MRAMRMPVARSPTMFDPATASRARPPRVRRVRERLAQHRTDEQVAERGRQLRVRRLRPGLEQVLLAAQRDEHRGDRRQHEREAVRCPAVCDADDEQHDGRDEAHDALGAEHRAVRAEAAVARERAPRDVRHVVRDDADDQRHEQHDAVVEHACRDRAERARARRRSLRARGRRRASRPASRAARRRCPAPAGCASARPTSCSSGWKKPGRDANTIDPEAEERRVVDLRVADHELAVRERSGTRTP